MAERMRLKYWARDFNSISSQFAFETEEQAINAAKCKVNESGDPQVVVKVIKIVKPTKPPVVVEKVV